MKSFSDIRFHQLKAEKKAGLILDDEGKYTNTNNPFNDPNLTSTFIWSKKLAAEGKAELSQKQIEKMQVNWYWLWEGRGSHFSFTDWLC